MVWLSLSCLDGATIDEHSIRFLLPCIFVRKFLSALIFICHKEFLVVRKYVPHPKKCTRFSRVFFGHHRMFEKQHILLSTVITKVFKM